MPPRHLKVHRVMGRGDFDRPCAKGRVNRFISYDGYYSIHRRKDDTFAYHILKPLIIRIDGNVGIVEILERAGKGS